jgi:outer membrane protein assembly factor BamB
VKFRIFAALAALAVLLAAVASAPAHDRRHGDGWQAKPTFLDRIDLPGGFQPEGIASGRGTTFYVGSIPTGAVNVGDFTTNGTKPLVPAQTGRAAIGLKFKKGRLFVAGGPTGKAFVYDAKTGADVKTFDLATGDAPTFINDVVIARGTAWFTDSMRPVLYAVDKDLGSSRTLQLTGFTPAPGFNLNGIVAVKDHGRHWRGGDKRWFGKHHARDNDDRWRGKHHSRDHDKGSRDDDDRFRDDDRHGDHKRGHRARASHGGEHGGLHLLAVQTNTGALWNIDSATGQSAKVDLGGATLANGDGMLLSGRKLFVVQNQLNQIAVVKLSRDFLRGRVIATIKRDGFDVPTTIAASGKHLYAVNARFGTEPGPNVPYWITKVF